jgi:hypothetical protein
MNKNIKITSDARTITDKVNNNNISIYFKKKGFITIILTL